MQKKNQENKEISNRQQSAEPNSDSVGSSAGIYHYRQGILFYSSSTNQRQPEVKPCKAKIWKGKNKSSVQRQHAELKARRTNDLEGENESWKKFKKSF